MRGLLLYICLVAVSQIASAQQLKVEKCYLASNDLSASKYVRKDQNGDACALVKVQLAATDVSFEGNVILPVEYKGGEYWVYMTNGAKELRLKHVAETPNFIPLHVRFEDYGISAVRSLYTYNLSLNMPQATFQQIPLSNGLKFVVNGVSFNMVHVEGGKFKMGGSSWHEYPNQRPIHKVTLSDYYIGETEVTHELWQAVMGSNPSHHKDDDLPVEGVSWDDCQEFIQRLNEQTGLKFRLPTEAEWEFAARGGNKSRGFKYSGSNNLGDVAWYEENSGRRTHPVKTKQANELGLYDMSGNVTEWCQDWYGPYSRVPKTNPIGDVPNTYDGRIKRGGNFFNGDVDLFRTSHRDYAKPSQRGLFYGLRLVL